MALIYLSIAWVIGIFAGSKLIFPLWAFAADIIPLLLIPFMSRYRTTLILSCLCLFVFLAGNVHFQSSLPVMNERHLLYYNDEGKLEIEGMITVEPEVRDKASLLQLSANKITLGNETREISGKVIIRVSRYAEYHYGDMIKVSGNLETPPQLGDFNYKDYLAHQGIYSIMYYPKIQVLERGGGSRALAFIYSLRGGLGQSLSNALPEPQGSLAQGILLGLRGGIPQSLRQEFSRTGTAHLLAISGLHLSIIIGLFLTAGIRLLGRRYYLYVWLAFAAIWFYAVITGMSPPVVRGAIMGSMFLLAELLGRQRSAATALTFAAAIMVGFEPQILWDAGFQLSFLSMAGLIFIFPFLQAYSRKWLPATMNTGGLAISAYTIFADSLAVTLSAILAAGPVVAYYFGVVSLIALPANLFAIPSLPAIIITAAIVSIVGLILPLVAHILSWIAWFFLSYLILIVHVFDTLPFSSIRLDDVQVWQVLVYYIILIVAGLVLTHRNQLTNLVSSTVSQTSRHNSNNPASLTKKWSTLPVLIAAVLVWTGALTIPDNNLRVSILNVGQGDAILVQTPGHHKILIDGGPSPQAIKLELSKKLPFWDRTIDLIIVTQPQADHITGLVEILRNYNVKHVVTSKITYNSLVYNQMLNLIQSKRIKYSHAHAGQEISYGDGIKIEVLHPPISLLQKTAADINKNGMVLRLSYNETSFLFTADIDEEVEWYLISQRARLNSTVLKVAHHGSRTSTSAELLAVANPSIAVISVANANNFGHPHPEVITRLYQRIGTDKVLLTATNGTIEFITDGKRLWVKTEH